MKTITVKLPEDEARELDEFVKRRSYPSRSELIRHLIMEKLDRNRREKMGWLSIAEKSMKKIWDNDKDEMVWIRYLNNFT
jgi:metal-responsive CopG/Arc/MetJ family transcriptional regulator